jgi:antitoxin (DNA-binding transcriptional repressor) of toxin-antitoxin stability system
MPQKWAEPPVRAIGSRELHKSLPILLRELQEDGASFVLTVHGKPKAVLLGTDAFLKLLADLELEQGDSRLVEWLRALLEGKREIGREGPEDATDLPRPQADEA